MLGLGVPELILVFVIALVIFGPKKIPDIGKAVGKGLSEFRKATSAVNKEVLEQEKSDDKIEDATKKI